MKNLDVISRRFRPARFHYFYYTLISIAAFLLLFVPNSSTISNGLNEYTVYLTARPDVITAETGSSTTITIEVRDSDGHSPPNGTVVDLSASLGRIDPRAILSNGVARARMASPLSTGVSLITAAVKGSRGVAETRVEVLPAGTKLERMSSLTISTDKGQLLYDSERYIVDGVGGVEISLGGLKIKSFYAIIDIYKKSIRVKAANEGNPVTLQRGNDTIIASEALLDLNKMTGLLFSSNENAPRRQMISLRDLKPRDELDPRSLQGPVQPVSGVFLIGAKKIIAKPGKEIKLINATFYLEGDKTMTLPFYRVPLSAAGGRSFTYGSEGIRADIPIYLGLNESSSTALRFRRQEQQGWGYYGGSKRWETDLIRDYDMENGASGQVAIRRIGTADWGLRWTGRNDFGNGLESYVYIDTPSHSDVYANFDLSKTADKYTSSFTLRANKMSASKSSYYTSTSYQMRPFQLGAKTLTMSLSGRGFYDSGLSAVGNHLGASTNVQFYAGPFSVMSKTDMSAQVSLGNVWGGANPGKSVYGNVGLYRDFGPKANLGINYNYTWDDTDNGGTFDYISADLYLSPFPRISTRFNVIKGLKQSSTSSFGNLSYQVAPNWEFRALATWQTYSDYSYTDAQVGIVRTLRNQEARLFYSKSRKRMLFEFAAAGL